MKWIWKYTTYEASNSRAEKKTFLTGSRKKGYGETYFSCSQFTVQGYVFMRKRKNVPEFDLMKYTTAPSFWVILTQTHFMHWKKLIYFSNDIAVYNYLNGGCHKHVFEKVASEVSKKKWLTKLHWLKHTLNN